MRETFTVLWEAMVAELRATNLDMHARATFVKDGESVQDTRGRLADLLPKPALSEQQRETRTIRSASKLSRAFDDGFVEVG